MDEDRAMPGFQLFIKLFINMKFLLGQKLKMAQIFDKKRNVIPVTLIEAGPCQVLQIKTKEPNSVAKSGLQDKKPRTSENSVRGIDGYEAIQIGFQKLKEKKVKKPQKQKPFRYIREFKGDIDISKYKVGNTIDVSIFEAGDEVSISGISKGKGFQGAVKRWGFAGRGASHGVKHEARTLGSVGSSFPERVIKGRKMPGRMGSERVTVKNLKIVKIDAKNNILVVTGAIPGRKGTLIEIRG